jgi:hypothetical protein
MSVDTLIDNAETRAMQYSNAALQTAYDLKNYAMDYKVGLLLPPDLDLSSVFIPTYQAPPAENSPMPVYEPPLSHLPTAPQLADISAVTIPAHRTEPTLNLSNLFKQTPPSPNLPPFNEAEPDLHIDQLVAQMDAIARPVLHAIDLPSLTPLNLGATPGLTIPGYNAAPPPDTLADPENYAQAMASAYDRMLPEMQHFIDDKVSGWINQYAPEYTDWNTRLHAKVSAAIEGEVLPDQFETALITRARGRAERDFVAVEQGLLEAYSKRGFYEPPGALMAGLHAGRLKNAGALADQSTDIYIERRKTEVQHLQFVMGLAASNLQSVRGLAVSYAGVVANTMQQALGYATALATQLGQVFEHLIARANLAISVMEALRAEYETRLKAALASLDGFKLKLEAEKLRADVEIAQIQFIEAQINIEDLQVKQYSALIDAVSRKASTEELKLKGYEIRGDIFKKRTDAKLAEYEVYKAALEGDKYKMDGEMTKLTVFEELIKTDELNLDAQIKAITATEAHNNALVEIFKSGGEVYKLDAESAVQKFSAYAEVKKLAQLVHSTELTNALETFKSSLEIPKIFIDIIAKTYELDVKTAIDSATLNMGKLQTAAQAMAKAADVYGNVATASVGALNTVVSSSIQAAAQ